MHDNMFCMSKLHTHMYLLLHDSIMIITAITYHCNYLKLISQGHIHLSHSFIIHALSLKLLKDSLKSMVFPTPHSPHVYGEEH